MNFSKLELSYRMANMQLNRIMTEADKLAGNESGETPVKALIMIFVVAILAGALLPTGIDSLVAGKNASGNWSASETATYAILGILIIIAAALLIIRLATD